MNGFIVTVVSLHPFNENLTLWNLQQFNNMYGRTVKYKKSSLAKSNTQDQPTVLLHREVTR